MLLSKLTNQLGGQLAGSGDIDITGLATLKDAGPDDISFITGERYGADVFDTAAGALIVHSTFPENTDVALLRVADVAAALDAALELFSPEPDFPESGVHETALVEPTVALGPNTAIGEHVVVRSHARIGPGTVIGPGSYIGKNVAIGESCTLGPHVVVHHGSELGDRVNIYANATIGADGFGYRLVDGRHKKIRHIGKVVIEDDVDIGANSCVDRAKFGRTVIGRGTKIDNLVQIGHNVVIGENCIVVGQTGISGSTELGNYVVLGGQCGLADHLKIGDGVMAGAQSGITKDIKAGMKIVGFPAREFQKYYRDLAQSRRIPEIIEDIKALKKRN
jgi:UDP-3-O-[3-hydroxymyristoyl] glucosamine N-acyltransferase